MVRFMSLSSGSSGNCYYLGTEEKAILIDAGIPAKQITAILKSVGISLESIMAVFVTHDHADHIKALGTLGEKCFIPIYATKETHRGIQNSYCTTHKLQSSTRYVEKEVTLHFHGFDITPFEVPHDGTDNVGYTIVVEGKQFCFVTDLGHITDTIASHIVSAEYLIMESNYDEQMLHMGNYPKFLKERITSPHGHLSNRMTASFLAGNYPKELKYLWLCHLSGENNHPELAFKEVERQLLEIGKQVGRDLCLATLKRNTPSELYVF